MTEEQELVCVHSCQGWDLAQVFRSKLEAMNIPVLLKYESASLVFGITVDGLGKVRIMVPEEHAADAKALLDVDETLEEDPSDEAQEQSDAL